MGEVLAVQTDKLRSGPQHPHKKVGVAVLTYDPSTS